MQCRKIAIGCSSAYCRAKHCPASLPPPRLPSLQAALNAPEAARLVQRLRAFDLSEVSVKLCHGNQCSCASSKRRRVLRHRTVFASKSLCQAGFRAGSHTRPSLQFGAPAWLEQHEAVEQLNLQAHLNAQAHADEFVKEALVLHDKLGLLVRELLAAEVGAGCWVLRQAFRRCPWQFKRAAAVHHSACGWLREHFFCCTKQTCRARLFWSPNASTQLRCPPGRRQVWRERLLPLLEGHLAERVDSVTAYRLVYQEAALANLLEVCKGARRLWTAWVAVTLPAVLCAADWRGMDARGAAYLVPSNWRLTL